MAREKPIVKLIREDGNAFNIMGRVIRALRTADQGDLVEQFTKEATSGDYNHLLAVCMNYCEVE